MCEFIIAPGTAAMVIGQEQEWSEQNFKAIRTMRMNQFTRAAVILDPWTGECNHYAPNAQSLGAEYAKKGYLGFRHGGYCMIVQADKVYVDQKELQEGEAA